MNCTHEIEFLVGTAEGIVCRNCRQKFDSFAEIEKSRNGETPEEVIEAKPKRKRKGEKADA